MRKLIAVTIILIITAAPACALLGVVLAEAVYQHPHAQMQITRQETRQDVMRR